MNLIRAASAFGQRKGLTANFPAVVFFYQRKGLLMCYKSDKVGEEEWNIGKRGIQEGLGVQNLSALDVEKLEPKANLNIKGTLYHSRVCRKAFLH